MVYGIWIKVVSRFSNNKAEYEAEIEVAESENLL